MNILVVRFRQMGDAILATSLLNTLRHNFPEAQIHFVLNEKIAPLFQGHPSIDKIITFAEEERHNFVHYLKRVGKLSIIPTTMSSSTCVAQPTRCCLHVSHPTRPIALE